MTESAFARVKRIVSANLTDMVDRLESAQAELVMKEAIREVERAVAEIRDEQGKALQRALQAANQITVFEAKIADLNGKIDFAIGQKRDDLAKAAIASQADLEAQIKVLRDAQAEAEAEQVKLADYVAALGARKRDMETELKTILQAKAAAEAAMPTANKDRPAARADVAASAFKRAMESASGLSGTASASAGDAAKLAELEALSHGEMIERRLAAAKQRMSA